MEHNAQSLIKQLKDGKLLELPRIVDKSNLLH